ncbi:TPA: hypothetical protein DHW62_04085 [candidate division WWE3 bacterium]|uniref:Uncharacterized protein n=1 Tax=candidate division WWE3 bacterium TaxID=2053526 RepID=A0A656PNF3_UNCKA|nr:hypothetical protein P147_WWE3C00001G0320 [candidate division WWE3 bacterium RAAC2_WWE3_1]KKS29668.1 MAG: hypothetical protein UU91_C0004G0060 [candidate division WWE3 bacterium GW2011_GWB1_42_117]KKS55478.1 MAG: hypothetical protein UV21_C0001G0060 [candidate division WWE3 bacterium GW2011_GWD2_42_34]KKT05963.1 MAG: hypothetical protein UV83_C0001G0281 [candidate division WWE3 bacterium GW2011_GWE2_43_18]KKT06881.1 MAG: hypothetical protein UV84_C0003G0017 [candidate division WWE3 bacterium
MQSQILEKLKKELGKDIENESQVVYILSLIRKLLEIEKLKSRYPILNFYCNWTLHSEMTDTEGKFVNNMLRKFIEKPEEKYKLSFHLQFLEQFKTFLTKKNITIPTKDNLEKFRYQLQKIISNTPIFVKTGTKYKVEFNEPQNKGESGLYITTIIDP